MKREEYLCDKCGDNIPGSVHNVIAGGNEKCTLMYAGVMGNNKFPNEGFHYHYSCFSVVIDAILSVHNGERTKIEFV